jgi:hypothetical protein
MRQLREQMTLEQQVLNLLAAHLHGMKSPRLRGILKPRISQPTLSRLLASLRARGLVVKTGAARATRYHLVGGGIGAAELHSRLLHEQVAGRLARDPVLKAHAMKRLESLREANPAGHINHERWAALLASDMPTLLRAMTEDSERAAVLRRESPFTALYDRGLRRHLLQSDERQTMQGRLKFSRSALARLCRQHRVQRLSLFGSAVRADFRPDSDVDVLVEFEPHQTPALGEMADMREELSELFGGRKVDLATPAILRNPYRRKAIERDLETVYAAE